MANLKPASTFVAARTALVDKNGMATWSFIKILQDWDTKLSNGLNSQGQFIGEISPSTIIAGRTAIGAILQYIDDGGKVLAPGIDFSRSYPNKDTDHIGDGAGSPLAGGKIAYKALVANNPLVGETLRYNGLDWTVVAIAISKSAAASQWLNSYDANTGQFTASQPAFGNISGVASAGQIPPLSSLSGSVTPGQVPALSALSGSVTAGQVPALSALSGRITTGQLPSGLYSGTVALARLTVSGTDGSLTLVNGAVSAYTAPT